MALKIIKIKDAKNRIEKKNFVALITIAVKNLTSFVSIAIQ